MLQNLFENLEKGAVSLNTTAVNPGAMTGKPAARVLRTSGGNAGGGATSGSRVSYMGADAGSEMEDVVEFAAFAIINESPSVSTY
jgi:hypothetical protein